VLRDNRGRTHPGRCVDEVGGQPREPGDLDSSVPGEEAPKQVPLSEVSMHPSRHEVGDLLMIACTFTHVFILRARGESGQSIDTMN
jgi:hypothetical protein